MQIEKINEVFLQRFGYDINAGLARLEEIAGNAIVLDNGTRRSGFSIGTVRMSDADFAIIAFFAGVGRLSILDTAIALPPKRT